MDKIRIMDLSIVIPVYEESKKIANDIKEAGDFLASNHFAGEIIVVDDGSEDNTSETAKKTGFRQMSGSMSCDMKRTAAKDTRCVKASKTQTVIM